jgi:5'-methylthioadenosine phosphorylase
MINNKLAIIGVSGLYDINEFKERELLKLETPWENLQMKFKNKI